MFYNESVYYIVSLRRVCWKHNHWFKHCLNIYVVTVEQTKSTSKRKFKEFNLFKLIEWEVQDHILSSMECIETRKYHINDVHYRFKHSYKNITKLITIWRRMNVMTISIQSFIQRFKNVILSQKRITFLNLWINDCITIVITFINMYHDLPPRTRSIFFQWSFCRITDKH